MVDFPKLFERNFIVGFFLPLALFLASLNSFTQRMGFSFDAKNFVTANPFLSGFIVWLGSVFLLGINRQVVRVKEGYGRFNPARFWAGLEKRRFRKLLGRIEQLDQQYLAEQDSEKKREVLRMRTKLGSLRAERFPDSLSFLLPTAFGNVMRAFEIYPRVIYGFESICGWSRLLAVVPKDYRDLVDSSKAQVDFWLNLWALSCLFILTTLCGIIDKRAWHEVTYPLASLIVMWISSRCARSAAAQWGETIKATFDVFLPALRKTLGFDREMNREQERKFWTDFSQVMTYRDPEALPDFSTTKKEEAGFLGSIISCLKNFQR